MTSRWSLPGVLTAVLVVALSSAPIFADWPTHRGNPQRTGNTDGLPGPKTPRVLWVHKSQDHFVASPVPGVQALYVSGLGAFNTAGFHALGLDPMMPKRVLWSKAAPYLKLPLVSSPAVAEGKLVFGDGMHQNDGGVLHGLRADTGLPLWQLTLPGRLIHLEGSPTIAEGRVYMGGGNAGVLCVDLKRVTLDGKELDLPAAQAILEKRWTELLAKFEEEKKKDPDFAIPPSEDALPKPVPRRLWQQGQDQWHVDASVAVVGERVLAASSYLEEERLGARTLLCLKASDGSVVWKTPLALNPWAGPTVANDLVLVGCSSIRFDPKAIPQARGEVVALDRITGTVKWRKSVPGGIVSPIAVQGDRAFFSATDGKVRAWDWTNGQEKWSYHAQAPLFAAPAVAHDLVYAADLKGVVHAIQRSTGKNAWRLDLASDPAVRTPGMVYGSPVVHGGRLYVATCNLEGDRSRQPTCVVCIGEK